MFFRFYLSFSVFTHKFFSLYLLFFFSKIVLENNVLLLSRVKSGLEVFNSNPTDALGQPLEPSR